MDNIALQECSTTIQVNDKCNLNCSYCYQITKGQHTMSFDTGKKIVDLLFNLYEENDLTLPINKNMNAINISFIGGEPLLSIQLITQISNYFLSECWRRNHIWKDHYQFSFDTNGLLYQQKECQEYFKKYQDHIRLSVSIDGPREMNDACRKDFNGNGSFDRTYSAIKQYAADFGIVPNINIVISPENLPYLANVYEFIKEIWPHHCSLGTIADYKWTPAEATIYYQQLISLANKNLNEPIYDTLDFFKPELYLPIEPDNTLGACGGMNKYGLVFGWDGKAYNCLRFAPCSLPIDRPSLAIGSCDGLYNNAEAQITVSKTHSLTKRDLLNEECLQCPIAKGCIKCIAINYMETGQFKDIHNNECWMHRAAALAFSYFWNVIYRIMELDKRIDIPIDKTIALQIIPEEEYMALLKLSQRGD